MDKKAVVLEAHQRFAIAQTADSHNRKEQLDDVRFVRLGEQWPDDVKIDRDMPGNKRPMLVINRVESFCRQVGNEIRQNEPCVKFRPATEEAEDETAEILEGLFRNAAYESNLETAIDVAADWQIDIGVGYLGITTGYISDDSFDQEIKFRSIPEPLKVYFDPQSTEIDGSDARWCFITQDLPRDEFEREYPGVKVQNWQQASAGDLPQWVTDTMVRVAEYYRISTRKRKLLQIDADAIFLDEIPQELREMAEQQATNKRTVETEFCEWFKLAGNEVIEHTELPFSGLGIIPVYGNMRMIEGKKHIYGLVRHAKDPQRQYNYLESANTESIALAPKAPFIGAFGQFEGFEKDWAQANRFNFPFLQYNPVVIAEGQRIQPPAPQRAMPPQASSAYESGMARAVDDIKATIGIFDASLGNRESDQSGIAIRSQQQQAAIGNFHYSDNLAKSIKRLGKLFMEAVPKVYNERRTLQILGIEGETKTVLQDPNQPQAMREVHDEEGEIKKIFNLGIGRYSVVVDTGPSYVTKRQEALAIQQELVRAYPQMMPLVGDLIVRNIDSDFSEEMADRLKLMLPPQLQQGEDGEKPDPKMQMASQQMNQMASQMEQMAEALQDAQAKLEDKSEELRIKQYEAETKRLAVEAKISLLPGELEAQVINQLNMGIS